MRNETFGYHCPRTWVLTNILWQFLFEGSVRRKPVSVQKTIQHRTEILSEAQSPHTICRKATSVPSPDIWEANSVHFSPPTFRSHRFCQSATVQTQYPVYRQIQSLFKLAVMLPSQPCLQSAPQPAQGPHISERGPFPAQDFNERAPSRGHVCLTFDCRCSGCAETNRACDSHKVSSTGS